MLLKQLQANYPNACIIQDCAQSTDTVRDYSIADVNIFSFYPTKPLASMGDGGMICTDDEVLAKSIREYCFYGLNEDGDTNNPGINSRMDEIQAGIVNVKFPHLDFMNNKRIKIAHRYLKALEGNTQITTMRPQGNCVYHQFAILVDNRDEFIEQLTAAGIPHMIHYPNNISEMIFQTHGTHKVQSPINNKILSLPCNTWMQEEEIELVVNFLEKVKK